MDDASIALGTVVGERYSVEALVGLGGLAEVYRVRHLELGSVHALKLLTWNRKSLTERLLLEGRIQAQLTHPHIVRVTDVVRIERRVGLMLEFIEGPSLEELLEHHGALSVPDALGLFAPILAAVAYAHDAGVLHRDMKPANVLLARAPGGWVPKVTDFGLAKVVEEGLGPNTRTGISMGTPGYMPPEQVRNSASADVRTDIFALGSLLYEMIAGRKAFAPPDGSPIELTATIDRTPEPLTETSPELWAAIERSLSPEREDRFADARSFAEALSIADHPSLAAAPDLVPVPLALDPSTYPSNPSGEPVASGNQRALPTTPVPLDDAPRSAGPLVVAAVLGSVVLSVAVTALMTQPVLESRQAREAARADVATQRTERSEAVPTTPAPAPEPVLAPEPEPVIEPKVATPVAVPPPATPPLPTPQPVDDEIQVIEVLTPEPLETSDANELIGVEVPTPALLDDGATDIAPVEVAAPDPGEDQGSEPPEPPPGPTLPIGTWTGEASSRPFELEVRSSTDGRVEADARFYAGSGPPRVERLEGNVDVDTGELLLTSPTSKLVFDGRWSGRTIVGQYMRGARALPWRVTLP